MSPARFLALTMRQAAAIRRRWLAHEERWERRFLNLQLMYINAHRDRDLHPAPITVEELQGKPAAVGDPKFGGLVMPKQSADQQIAHMRQFSQMIRQIRGGGTDGQQPAG